MDDLADTVCRARRGDRSAFCELVVHYRPMVVGIGRGILRDAHEAEDAAQETFARVWGKLETVRAAARFPGWLRTVARSVAINRLRTQRPLADERVQFAADLTPGPERTVEVEEFTRAVLDAIADLPDGWREPIEMFHQDGIRLSEIAKRLGIGEGNARTRLSRARMRLAATLGNQWPVEMISRAKEARGWLPSALTTNIMKECRAMTLTAAPTRRKLPRGDCEVTIRALLEEDLPSLRRFDLELDASLEESNAALPPGLGSEGGGPWSRDDWLAAHFAKYQQHGNLTLIAEEEGRIVGFADLWVADEPAPFGRSLDVECIDYFREHYLLGIETVLLGEAEAVARAAGIPALDIGTNTVSGDYMPLRRFGLRVFYEYDEVVLRTDLPAPADRPQVRPISPASADLTGLIKVSHWSPTDFGFRDEQPFGGGSRLLEISWPNRRALLELWRFDGARADGHPSVPPHPPNRAELYVSASSLLDAVDMNEILVECAVLAKEVGADEIALPIPSEIELASDLERAGSRAFQFAWFRKVLC